MTSNEKETSLDYRNDNGSYKSIDECRPEIVRYDKVLRVNTNDKDPKSRQSQSTKRYRQDLRWFDHWLDAQDNLTEVSDLNDENVDLLIFALDHQFNGSTKRQRWDQISSMYDYFERKNIVDQNPLAAENPRKRGLTKTTEQEIQIEPDERYALTAEEVRKMEKNVKQHGPRDKLIIRLMWQTGVRRTEASYLTTKMFNYDQREIEIPGEITKNGMGRVVPYQETLDGLLNDWLDFHRDDMAMTADHDYLFVGERGGRLSGQRINEIVRDAAIDAGINRKLGYTDANGKERWLITAHNLRHGYGTYMANETDAGLWEISKLMGHKSIETTQNRYVAHDERAGTEHGHKYGPK
ncbi:tyrosine-type recombinase/integrase [Halorientalis regularis]|nr:site-specific integrase [Halorientalis regularis]